MLRAVLFDLDGVFVESREVWFDVMQAVARKFGYPEITAEQIQRAWGQSIADDRKLFYPGLTVEQLECEYNLMFPQSTMHLVVDAEGPKVVEALRAREMRIAVVTNSPAEGARAMLDRAGIVPDALVCGTDVPAPKPAPDGIHKALAMLGVRAEEAIYVGDTSYDREAGRRAGVRFFGYRIDGDARIESLLEIMNLLS
ncbi:MAG: HAD family hydrolase [Candidatus Binataceae bacterium]